MKLKMLNWCKRFNIFCLLDNEHYQPDSPFNCLIGAGAIKSIGMHKGKAYEMLNSFRKNNKDYIFGHLCYDLKNETEQLVSVLPDGIDFPDIFFFIPQVVLILNPHDISIGVLNDQAALIYQQILNTEIEPENTEKNTIYIKNRISRNDYIKTINELKRHIQRGDCYEINFCQEFYAEDAEIDPYLVFKKLIDLSPNPFAGLYRYNDKFLICASPEIFLKKSGSRIISQPVKGTSKRDIQNVLTDLKNRQKLLNSTKERSENIMVTDLVRNDLSKICSEGTVCVDELLGVYSFPQVHQMISTISGILSTDNIADIFNATFPMGSMTGVPKKKVMELIEKFEHTRRGLYSGSLGYFSPQGDFDFNVVIRSILYNKKNKYLSIQAGSAITSQSDPIEEYEECLLKIAATKSVLA